VGVCVYVCVDGWMMDGWVGGSNATFQPEGLFPACSQNWCHTLSIDFHVHTVDRVSDCTDARLS